MNPFTPLPSFYEMMLIEEAQRSAQKILMDAMEYLRIHSSQQRSQGSSTVLRMMIDRMLYFVEFLVQKYGPEVRFLITYLIERRFIRGSSATMSESIYGGKRVKILPDNRLEALTPSDQSKLLLTITGSSYMDEKLELLIRRWNRLGNNNHSKFQSFFLQIYPFLRMSQHGTVLAYQLLYLTGKSKYFHPLSHLLGIAVRRLTHADIAEQPPDPTQTNQQFQKWTTIMRRVAFWALTSTALVGWWHQFQQQMRRQERQHQPATLIPPPPMPISLKLNPRDRIRTPKSSEVCPLCQQPWIAPSVAPCGYVFCHKCLVLYVREHGTCPLTGTPCKEQDLIRIYEPQATTASGGPIHWQRS